MLYASYRDDGAIHQANKVYDQPDYGALLAGLGHRFVAINRPGLISPERWYVDVTAREIVERPAMGIAVERTAIRAGGSDAAIFTGIPRGARFEAMAAGASIHLVPDFPESELELHIPVPCVYRVRFSLWPYSDFEIDIEASA